MHAECCIRSLAYEVAFLLECILGQISVRALGVCLSGPRFLRFGDVSCRDRVGTTRVVEESVLGSEQLGKESRMPRVVSHCTLFLAWTGMEIDRKLIGLKLIGREVSTLR